MNRWGDVDPFGHALLKALQRICDTSVHDRMHVRPCLWTLCHDNIPGLFSRTRVTINGGRWLAPLRVHWHWPANSLTTWPEPGPAELWASVPHMKSENQKNKHIPSVKEGNHVGRCSQASKTDSLTAFGVAVFHTFRLLSRISPTIFILLNWGVQL